MVDQAVAQYEGEVEVVVLIKAAPEIGKRHGETVCVAGVDAYGSWHRLYPVPFKDLKQQQRFHRWDRIRVRWKRPSDDDRVESKRIDPQSLKILSKVAGDERREVAERAVVPSLEDEMTSGRSLALIRPTDLRFTIRKLSSTEFEKSSRRRLELGRQPDFFATTTISKEPPPYQFGYTFHHAGRQREHVCIDWETERTFFKWRDEYGEERALHEMKVRWGEKIPARGVVFAMGTHRVKIFKNWLLSAVIQAPEPPQTFMRF